MLSMCVMLCAAERIWLVFQLEGLTRTAAGQLATPGTSLLTEETPGIDTSSRVGLNLIKPYSKERDTLIALSKAVPLIVMCNTDSDIIKRRNTDKPPLPI